SVLFRLDPHSGDLVELAASGYRGPGARPGAVLPRGQGLAALAVREGRPMASVDVLEDARVGLDAELRHRLQGSGHAAALAAPLVTGRGVTGVLVVRDDRGRRFTENDISIAAAFADQAAVVLENARLYRRAKDRAEKLRALSTLTQRITSATHSQAAF